MALRVRLEVRDITQQVPVGSARRFLKNLLAGRAIKFEAKVAGRLLGVSVTLAALFRAAGAFSYVRSLMAGRWMASRITTGEDRTLLD